MMNYKKDYYSVLGIDKTADKATIKRNYRRLAKIYHPDVNHSEKANAVFKQLTEAYEVLYDDEQRRIYDRQRLIYTAGNNVHNTTYNATNNVYNFVNEENIKKGVKFVADLERDYGLISELISIGLSRSTKGKIVNLLLTTAINKSAKQEKNGQKGKYRHGMYE